MGRNGGGQGALLVLVGQQGIGPGMIGRPYPCNGTDGGGDADLVYHAHETVGGLAGIRFSAYGPKIPFTRDPDTEVGV